MRLFRRLLLLLLVITIIFVTTLVCAKSFPASYPLGTTLIENEIHRFPFAILSQQASNGVDQMPENTHLVIRNCVFEDYVYGGYPNRDKSYQIWRNFSVSFVSCTFKNVLYVDRIRTVGPGSGLSVVNSSFSDWPLSSKASAVVRTLSWTFDQGGFIRFNGNNITTPDFVTGGGSTNYVRFVHAGTDYDALGLTTHTVDFVEIRDNLLVSSRRPPSAYFELALKPMRQFPLIIIRGAVNVSGNRVWCNTPESLLTEPKWLPAIKLTLGAQDAATEFYKLRVENSLLFDNNTFIMNTADPTGATMGLSRTMWMGIMLAGSFSMTTAAGPTPFLLSFSGNSLRGADGRTWETGARMVYAMLTAVDFQGSHLVADDNYVCANGHFVKAISMTLYHGANCGGVSFDRSTVETTIFFRARVVDLNYYDIHGVGDKLINNVPPSQVGRTAIFSFSHNNLQALGVMDPTSDFYTNGTTGYPEGEALMISDAKWGVNDTEVTNMVASGRLGLYNFMEVRVEHCTMEITTGYFASTLLWSSSGFENVGLIKIAHNNARIDATVPEAYINSIGTVNPEGVHLGDAFRHVGLVLLENNTIDIDYSAGASCVGISVQAGFRLGVVYDVDSICGTAISYLRNNVKILKRDATFKDKTTVGSSLLVSSPVRAGCWFTVHVEGNNFTIVSRKICPPSSCTGFGIILAAAVRGSLVRFDATRNTIQITSAKGGTLGVGIMAFSTEYKRTATQVQLTGPAVNICQVRYWDNHITLGDEDGLVFFGIGSAGSTTFALPEDALPPGVSAADLTVGLIVEGNTCRELGYAEKSLQMLSSSLVGISCPVGLLYTPLSPFPLPVRCVPGQPAVDMTAGSITIRNTSVSAAVRHCLGVALRLSVDKILFQDVELFSDQSLGASQPTDAAPPGQLVPRGELSVFIFFMANAAGVVSIRILTFDNVTANASTRCAYNSDAAESPTRAVEPQMIEASRRVGFMGIERVGAISPRITMRDVNVYIRCVDALQRVTFVGLAPRGPDQLDVSNSVFSYFSAPLTERSWWAGYRAAHDPAQAQRVSKLLAVEFLTLNKQSPLPIPTSVLNVTRTTVETLGNAGDALVTNYAATSRRWDTQGEVSGDLYCVKWGGAKYIISYRDAVLRRSVPGSSFRIERCPLARDPSFSGTASASYSDTGAARTATAQPSASRTVSPVAQAKDVGLNSATVENLETASVIAGSIASIAGNSPSALLASTRGLLLLRLAACKLQQQAEQREVAAALRRNVTLGLLQKQLSFPKSLTPGLNVGDKVGGSYRGAVLSTVFVILIMVLAVLYGASLNKIEWVRLIIESEKESGNGGGYRLLPPDTHMVGSKLLQRKRDEERRILQKQYEEERHPHLVQMQKHHIGGRGAAAAAAISVFDDDQESRRLLNITHEMLLDEAQNIPLYRFVSIDRIALKILVVLLPALAENCGILAGARYGGAGDVALGVLPLLLVCGFVAACGIIIFVAVSSDASKTDSALRKREREAKERRKREKVKSKRIKKKLLKQQQQQEQEHGFDDEEEEEGFEQDDDSSVSESNNNDDDDDYLDAEAQQRRRNRFFEENDQEDTNEILMGRHTLSSPMLRSPQQGRDDDDDDIHLHFQQQQQQQQQQKKKQKKLGGKGAANPRHRGRPGQDASEFDHQQQSRSVSSQRDDGGSPERSGGPCARPDPIFFTEDSVVYYPMASHRTELQKLLHRFLNHFSARFCFIGSSIYRNYNVNLFGRGLQIFSPSVFTNFAYSFSSFKGPRKMHLAARKKKRTGADENHDSGSLLTGEEELHEVSSSFTYESSISSRLKTTFLYISILCTVVSAAITGASQVDPSQCMSSFVVCFLLNSLSFALALQRPYTIPGRNVCLLSIESANALAATIFLVLMLRDASTITSATDSIAAAQILSTLPASIFGPVLTIISAGRFFLLRLAKSKVITLSTLRKHIGYELDQVEQKLKKTAKQQAGKQQQQQQETCWERWCGGGGDSSWDFDF